MIRWSTSNMFLVVAVFLAVFGLMEVPRTTWDFAWLSLFLASVFAFAFTSRRSPSKRTSS